MKRRTPLVLVAALAGATIAWACTTGDQEPSSADFVPSLEDVDCPPQVDNVLMSGYSCQLLTVRPESDKAPAVQLLVTQVQPTEGEPPADPLIVVGEDYGSTFNYAGIAPVADRVGRTVYFLNPRGVVGSQPSLECPEVDALARETLAAGGDAGQQAVWLGAVQTCHARLVQSGIDLTEFGEDAMPGDVLALVEALDVDSWNIGTWGTSGRVALRLLGQDPPGLRAVFLDSPSVPGDDPRTVLADDTRRGLEALFGDCERDRVCRRLPHSLAELDRAVQHLDDDPVDAAVESDGASVRVRVDGTTLMRLVRQAVALNGSSFAVLAGAAVPAMIDAASHWRPDLAPTLLLPLVASAPYCDGYLPTCPEFHRTTLGVYLTELCRNHDPFPILDDGPDAIGRFAAASPYVPACGSWVVAEDTDAPPTTTTSDVPVLAVVGEYTPYSDVERVRAFLADDPYAHVIEVPGWGHNAIAADPCLGDIRKAFFDAPTAPLADRCLASIREAPEFLPHL